jgi:hypothetical protein
LSRTKLEKDVFLVSNGWEGGRTGAQKTALKTRGRGRGPVRVTKVIDLSDQGDCPIGAPALPRYLLPKPRDPGPHLAPVRWTSYRDFLQCLLAEDRASTR